MSPVNQRVLAAVLATPLVVALVVVALLRPLPYTTYSPGPTIDVLSSPDDKEIIQIGGGEKTYRDNGQLRMTTVSVSPRSAELNLLQVMGSWLARGDAVYPYDSVYPDDKTPEQDKSEGQVQMLSSQDTASAVALRALGYQVPSYLEVQGITTGGPADGALDLRDLFVAVNGANLPTGDLQESADQLTSAIKGTKAGQQVELTVLRDGEQVTVPVTPEPDENGDPRVGITFGEGFDLPFPISVTIDPRIGGPSAGLMFSLAIYDTLTPGSLSDGGPVAGTGEIYSDGSVGPIGGIQQKIVGARQAGAELFLVPADNCDDAEGARNGDMRLTRVATFDDARDAIEAWGQDHDADLPTCGS